MRHLQQQIGFFWEQICSKPIDRIGPFVTLILSMIGLVAIHAAQSYHGGQNWIAQLVWIFIGICIYSLTAWTDYKWWLKHAHIVYILCIIPLFLLWTPLGESRYGALRWLHLGPIRFQPSELAKIGTLILGCSLLARSKIDRLSEAIPRLTSFGFVFFLPICLIFLQPDLGSALIFPPMAFSLLYVARLSGKFFLIAFAFFLLITGGFGWDCYAYCKFLEENDLSPIQHAGLYEKTSWVPLHDYQRNRILAFIAPEVVDPQGIGVSWNLRQSLIAVGGGGFWGKGDRKGTQAKLGYLPQSVAPNDFIFSVFAEERGFLGGLLVILLFMLLTFNGIRIACLSKDRFGLLLCVGSSVIFAVHAFVNIGMTIGLMPITGVPLPFLSYGGSFVVSCYFLQGISQSVYRYHKNYT